MSKLPIPVPPPGEIDGPAERAFRFVVPAQRHPATPGQMSLRGIGPLWLPSDLAVPLGTEREAASS